MSDLYVDQSGTTGWGEEIPMKGKRCVGRTILLMT